MIFGDRWRIYWTEHAANTYLYGSEVNYIDRNHVEFRNVLMPPGTIIKRWYSKTNYQMNRIEPSLPLIDGECRYLITVDIDVPEGEECLIRLVYYDRYGNEFDKLIITDKVTEFRCPLKTYSYEMQLINGGAESFVFHNVLIQEILDEEEQTWETV